MKEFSARHCTSHIRIFITYLSQRLQLNIFDYHHLPTIERETPEVCQMKPFDDVCLTTRAVHGKNSYLKTDTIYSDKGLEREDGECEKTREAIDLDTRKRKAACCYFYPLPYSPGRLDSDSGDDV